MDFRIQRAVVKTLSVGLLASISMFSPLGLAATPVWPAALAQDQGMPYTRSAKPRALNAIKDYIAIFPLSRYAYVKGYRVRLTDADLLRGASVMQDGKLYVPADFAGILSLNDIQTDQAPDYLASRWVYTIARPKISLPKGVQMVRIRDKSYVAIIDLAQAMGKKVYQNSRGLILIGNQDIKFDDSDATLVDCVVTLFDTPEMLADPDIATKYIPLLKLQGKWTDHVKVTPEQLKLLAGPETQYPEVPRSEYSLAGVETSLLGSKVPAPGVYPRILFSPQDIPALAERMTKSKFGQMTLIEQEVLFKKTFWDPTTSDGQVFAKLVKGDIKGLGMVVTPDNNEKIQGMAGLFPGQKPGMYNSHINYNANALTSMALYCLLTNDDVRGQEVANAIATYYRINEPLIDKHLAMSDSEFGTDPDKANSAETSWRGMHGVVPHMDIAFSLDFAGKWMSAEQKDVMRRIIAKATYGRSSYGQDGPISWRDTNHTTWHLTNLLAMSAIEGLEGFDAESFARGQETVRSFLDWGIDAAGQMYESNGKSGGGIEYQTLSMIMLGRRGDNLWGHPHWRNLPEAQALMTSPNGRAVLSSGTWGGASFEPQTVGQIAAFFPNNKNTDYLLSLAYPDVDLAKFDADAYRAQVEKNAGRIRLPGPTYCGFVRAFPFCRDWKRTERQELNLPLGWSDDRHGMLSVSSDGTANASWLAMQVRPNHYIGSGHHHADLGMFYFSGQGVNWVTESPFAKTYDGRFHNEVLIDGIAEANGTPARATYLGANLQKQSGLGIADLTYAYSWKWLTQVQLWDQGFITPTDAPAKMGWELETDPKTLARFVGTQHYKMRLWWPTYTFSNWMPTLRAPWNPVKYAFRTAGLVRGNHSYGVVVDDVKKDDQTRLYQWTAMLAPGVWQADVAGLPKGQIALGYRLADPKLKAAARSDIKLSQGDPMLLVVALDPADAGDAQMPLVKVETLTDKEGKYDRLSVNLRAAQSNFKVLMIPAKFGEEMPKVTFNVATGSGSIQWNDQKDSFLFTKGDDGRTRFVTLRGDKTIATNFVAGR